MVKLLRRLEELIGWVRMQFKPRKCRALVLRKGKIVSDSFEIGDGVGVMLMPSVLEKPVKCLGRLYTAALSDSERKVEVRKDIEDGLRVISDCKLQGTLKCWSLDVPVRITSKDHVAYDHVRDSHDSSGRV
jgi:hypothetical protein